MKIEYSNRTQVHACARNHHPRSDKQLDPWYIMQTHLKPQISEQDLLPLERTSVDHGRILNFLILKIPRAIFENIKEVRFLLFDL